MHKPVCQRWPAAKARTAIAAPHYHSSWRLHRWAPPIQDALGKCSTASYRRVLQKVYMPESGQQEKHINDRPHLSLPLSPRCWRHRGGSQMESTCPRSHSSLWCNILSNIRSPCRPPCRHGGEKPVQPGGAGVGANAGSLTGCIRFLHYRKPAEYPSGLLLPGLGPNSAGWGGGWRL